MRYLIAIVVAVVAALIATVFLSTPLANWIMSRMTFDNPDDVAAMHAMLFMAFNVAALMLGFAVGMMMTRHLEETDEN